jgi:hypothetical protein
MSAKGILATWNPALQSLVVERKEHNMAICGNGALELALSLATCELGYTASSCNLELGSDSKPFSFEAHQGSFAR